MNDIPERDVTDLSTRQLAQLMIISVHRALAGGTKHYDDRSPNRVLTNVKAIMQALRDDHLIIQPPAGAENFYRDVPDQPTVDLGLALPPRHCEYGIAYSWCRTDKSPAEIFCEFHLTVQCKNCGEQAIRQCHVGTWAICGTDICGGCSCPVNHYGERDPRDAVVARLSSLIGTVEEQLAELKAERVAILESGEEE